MEILQFIKKSYPPIIRNLLLIGLGVAIIWVLVDSYGLKKRADTKIPELEALLNNEYNKELQVFKEHASSPECQWAIENEETRSEAYSGGGIDILKEVYLDCTEPPKIQFYSNLRAISNEISELSKIRGNSFFVLFLQKLLSYLFVLLILAIYIPIYQALRLFSSRFLRKHNNVKIESKLETKISGESGTDNLPVEVLNEQLENNELVKNSPGNVYEHFSFEQFLRIISVNSLFIILLIYLAPLLPSSFFDILLQFLTTLKIPTVLPFFLGFGIACSLAKSFFAIKRKESKHKIINFFIISIIEIILLYILLALYANFLNLSNVSYRQSLKYNDIKTTATCNVHSDCVEQRTGCDNCGCPVFINKKDSYRLRCYASARPYCFRLCQAKFPVCYHRQCMGIPLYSVYNDIQNFSPLAYYIIRLIYIISS